jgi:site-specific recombinase XerD
VTNGGRPSGYGYACWVRLRWQARVNAANWFAAAHLVPRTSHTRWEQVSGHDVQPWLVHLLTRYSDAYASDQFRALQQFFRWLAKEEQLPDPMARLRAPKVTEKLVPVFTSEELSALEKTCQGRSFAQRRDAAVIAVLTATGIRAGELAGIRYDPGDLRRSDVDLWRREITVHGKGGRVRVVRIGHEAARAWTATSMSVPGMRRRGGRSCGWG